MKAKQSNPLMGKVLKWINIHNHEETNAEECLKKAYSAKEEVYHILEGQRELQAIGIASSEQGYAIEVNLTSPLPKEIARKLPKNVEGVPVRTEIVGSLII